ncbi:MAG TPA: hypothetical protein VLB87_08200, partial [Pyrinomonadaceae bacterium]|nr:hypothetical protein [Pyrinomonadaceae bacterium]
MGAVLWFFNAVAVAQAPLSDAERAELLKLIKSLQERVEKLEAAQAATAKAVPSSVPAAVPTPSVTPDPVAPAQPDNTVANDAATTPRKQDDDENKFDGRYTP